MKTFKEYLSEATTPAYKKALAFAIKYYKNEDDDTFSAASEAVKKFKLNPSEAQGISDDLDAMISKGKL